MTPAQDIHSFADPSKVRVTHCSLDLEVDFETRQLMGSALLKLQRFDPEAPLLLDTRDLTLEEVTVDGRKVNFVVGDRDPIRGSCVTVELPDAADSVLVRYSTQERASGLQWLDPPQTSGKKHPFLFTQSQSIHARSWIPIQDSPGVRVTYDARLKVPPGLQTLMSAERDSGSEGVSVFRMDLPIPAYLIALAVGDFDYVSTGPRTGIYADPAILPAAAHEFSDLEKLVETVERMYGPYRWKRYELLILPPSFPFGGMENPIVTFATPTVIAGDKSLVSLVSHELAHSWSGNLVTNATWSDFWLNEGFTTYIENRIQEEVYGLEQALMEQVLDRRHLDEELREFALRDQILHINLRGRDPDEGCTRVPYIKGALLLRLMEQTFGRNNFDRFLRSYFEHFAFQSITTEEALAYIRRELFDRFPKESAAIDLNEWVFQPGLPASAPRVSSASLELVSQTEPNWKTWNTQQWLEFLQTLPRPLTQDRMRELDAKFHLTSASNYEIVSEWLLMAIESNYEAGFDRLQDFLLDVGRMKYLRPLYSELMKTPAGETLALDIYVKARSLYHPIARTAVEKILLFQQKATGE